MWSLDGFSFRVTLLTRLQGSGVALPLGTFDGPTLTL